MRSPPSRQLTLGGCVDCWEIALILDNDNKVEMLGFENDDGAIDLLSQFGVDDFKSTLPIHLTDVLRKQYPELIITSIELLNSPTCNLGGMQDEENKTLVRVQQLHVLFPLRVSIRAGSVNESLDLEFVLKCDDLDHSPKITTDLFVKSQSRLD